MKTKTMLKLCVNGQCPSCKSKDISGDEVEIMAGTAAQDVSCLSCGAEWREFYTMNFVSMYERVSE